MRGLAAARGGCSSEVASSQRKALLFPMIPAALLALLRCPLTQQTLAMAPAELFAGRVDRDGRPLEAALVRADGAVLYPIREGIPVLLAEEAVAVAGK